MQKLNSQALPQVSKNTPTPIPQTKINRTNCQLLSIPTPTHPQLIQQLYLSHNKISSVHRKLFNFHSLHSLNLSYNELNNINQFIQEVENLPLKRLGLKMNYFSYGYQDSVVESVKTLSRLDDQIIETKESRLKIFQMKNFINLKLLTAFQRANYAIEKLREGANEIKGFSIKKLEIIVASMVKVYSMGKEGRNRMKSMKIIQEKMELLLELPEKQSLNYIEQCRNSFVELTSLVLKKFAARFHYKLLNTLTQEKNKENYNIEMLANRFGLIYNAKKYGILEENPGKYLTKINVKQLIDHPMMQFATRNPDPNRSTLDGDFDYSNSIYNIKDKDKGENEAVFENFPIFAYEPNYLDILYEVINEKMGEILRLFDFNEKNGMYINKSIYLSRQKQYLEQEPLRLEDGILKDNNENNRKTLLKNEHRNQRIKSLSNEQEQNSDNRLTLVSFDPIKNNNSNNNNNKRAIEKGKHEFIMTKTRPKNKHKLNIEKYSIHEISLIYKVLRALKKMKQSR